METQIHLARDLPYARAWFRSGASPSRRGRRTDSARQTARKDCLRSHEKALRIGRYTLWYSRGFRGWNKAHGVANYCLTKDVSAQAERDERRGNEASS